MKKRNRLASVMIALLILFNVATVAVSAAEAEAGNSVTVSFQINGVYSVDGYFTYSNPGLFSSVSYKNNSSLIGEISNDKLYLFSSDQTNVSLEVTVTVRQTAQVGDSCVITLVYETADINGAISDWMTQTQTVTVKAAQNEPVTQPDDPTPVDPTPVDPQPEPVWTQPKETEPQPTIDYTELLRQIAIAEGLKEEDYTADSWANMIKALEAAIALKTSLSQKDVDDGAEALKKAIADLVKLDLTALNKAVADAKALEKNSTCAHSPLWFKLFDALSRVDETVATRDQEKIDALTEVINGLVERIIADCPNCGQGGEVVKEVIKEVEVEPSGPFCNIPMHKVWPILFFISLGINLCLIGLLVWFFLKRRKNEKDDTPLVDYDIGDDL